MDGASRQFFTISYGVLDTQAQQFRYVSAGHPPLIHLSGGEPKIVKSEGFPVGVVSEPDYGEHVLAYRVCRADDSGVIHRFGIEGK